MATSKALPKHLEVGARSAVLISKPNPNMPYSRIALEIDLSAASQTLVDLGGIPLPTEDPKIVDTMIEKSLTVEPKDWYLTLKISKNAIRDDQTASLDRAFKNLLPTFQKHLNKRAFQVLNGGDGTTYGLCYDGQEFFDSDHTDPGGKYQTNQDNEYDLAFSATNFETVYVAAQKSLDDTGEYVNYVPDLIVTSPELAREVSQIAENDWIYSSADREKNPWEGRLSYITSPEMDAAAWVVVCSSEDSKPILVVVRQRPELNDMWFDSQAGNGGMHYIQYHARYDVVYGDWRLAYLGDS